MPRLLFTFCLSLVLCAGQSFAMADDLPEASPVSIKADAVTHEQEGDTFRAAGEVEISWGATTLTADRASLSQETGDATAEGSVRLTRQGDVLQSDRISINVATQQGEVINGDLFVAKPNLHVRGGKMARVGEDDYRLEDGSFTTCDGEVPSWKFAASDLEVTLEEYAVGRHAVFYVKDFPVFYTPYILFPVKRERQSGFLFPRIGSSTKKGFSFDLPYYWAITPSQDLTVDLDIQTRRGVGSGIDYRYLRPRESDGNIRGYGIYDASQSRFRGDVAALHREYLPNGVAARADVNLVTDRDFYRDFSVATGTYNRQLLDSSVSLTKTWQDASLSGELRYVQDLYAPDDRLTLQRLPTINYTLLGSRLGKLPAFVSLDSSLVNFYREEGQTGQRMEVHPAITAYAPIPGGGFALWGGYRQRLYSATHERIGGGVRGNGTFDAGVAVTTSLERVYDTTWGPVKNVRHSVIPELGYRFIEDNNQESLPFFDFHDRLTGQSLMTWGVSSYFTGKSFGQGGTAEYRDLLWLRISQDYRLRGERRDLLTLTDQGGAFSDIRLMGRLNPVKAFSLSFDSRIDPYRGSFSAAAVGGDVKDERGNSAGILYRMSRGVVEYFEGRIGLSLVKPLVFNYTGRYSFDRGDFLESVYAVEYRQQCWSVTFSFRDRPDNREFLVSFNLAGIGDVGPMKAF